VSRRHESRTWKVRFLCPSARHDEPPVLSVVPLEPGQVALPVISATCPCGYNLQVPGGRDLYWDRLMPMGYAAGQFGEPVTRGKVTVLPPRGTRVDVMIGDRTRVDPATETV